MDKEAYVFKYYNKPKTHFFVCIIFLVYLSRVPSLSYLHRNVKNLPLSELPRSLAAKTLQLSVNRAVLAPVSLPTLPSEGRSLLHIGLTI